MHAPEENGEDKMDGPAHVYWLHVAPRKHTGETVTLLITLAVLFVLLYLLVGRPSRPRHAHVSVPAHTSEKR